MYLGRRKVRSAGRGSGSVELTLPIQVSMLEGVECHLSVRDGSRPELLIQPDLSEAESVFRELWRMLSVGLADVDEIGDFSPADFTLTLLSAPAPAERPWLCYADALLLRGRLAGDTNGWPVADAEREAAGRILAALAAAAGFRLGLNAALARVLGDGTAYVMAGVSTDMGADFERGTAHQAFWSEARSATTGSTPRVASGLYEDGTWRLARGGLARIFRHCLGWQDDPLAYESARDHWYRALSVEMEVAATASTATRHDWRLCSL